MSADRPEETVSRLRESSRRRTAVWLALIAASPVLAAALTICVVMLTERISPGAAVLTAFQVAYPANLLLGAAGAAAAAMRLPVRPRRRVAAAVACFLVALFGGVVLVSAWVVFLNAA